VGTGSTPDSGAVAEVPLAINGFIACGEEGRVSYELSQTQTVIYYNT